MGDMLILSLIYSIPLLMVIWFMISVVSSLREQNKILKEIAKKLNREE